MQFQIKQYIDDNIKINSQEVTSLESYLKGDDFLCYEVSAKNICAFLRFLDKDKKLRFTILTDLFATDFLGREQEHNSKRFEICYNLLSLKHNLRLIVKVRVNENEDVPSISHLFSAACWYEREAFDLYGINFSNAKDLRRILTDYGFKGHPLRKDFPLTGHVEIRYDSTLREVIYEPVELEQRFRNFDFASPWQGPKQVLPGDEKATHNIEEKSNK